MAAPDSGDRMLPTCISRCWLPDTQRATKARRSMDINTHKTVRRLKARPILDGFASAAIATEIRRGRSAIRRAATVPASDCGETPSGSCEIKEASRRVAASFGNFTNRAASRQGSSSSRARAERTLNRIPFRSSPIDAKRKASNSVPRKLGDAARAISGINFAIRYVWRGRPSSAQGAFWARG